MASGLLVGPPSEHPAAAILGPPTYQTFKGTPPGEIFYDQMRNLFDAYAGHNQVLSGTVLEGINTLSTFLIKDVFKPNYTEMLEFTSFTKIVEKTLAIRGGPQVIGPGISIAKKKWVVKLRRMYHNFEMDSGWWKTEEGQEDFALEINELVAGFIRLLNLEALELLTNSSAIINSRQDQYFFREVIRNPIDSLTRHKDRAFLIQRKGFRGWSELHGILRSVVRKYGAVEPNAWLIPPEGKQHVNANESNTKFLEFGDRINKNLEKQEDTYKTVFDPPCRVVEVDNEIFESSESENPKQGTMYGDAVFQSHFELKPKDAPEDTRKYATHKRSKKVLTLNNDSMTLVGLEEMEANCHAWGSNKELHEQNWKIKSVFNKSKKPIPTEWKEAEMWFFFNQDFTSQYVDGKIGAWDVARFMGEQLSDLKIAEKMVETMMNQKVINEEDKRDMKEGIRIMRMLQNYDPSAKGAMAFKLAAFRQAGLKGGAPSLNRFGALDLPTIVFDGGLVGGASRFLIAHKNPNAGSQELYIGVSMDEETKGEIDIFGASLNEKGVNCFDYGGPKATPYGWGTIGGLATISELKRLPSGHPDRIFIEDDLIEGASRAIEAFKTFSKLAAKYFPGHAFLDESNIPSAIMPTDPDFRRVVAVCQNFLALPVYPFFVSTAAIVTDGHGPRAPPTTEFQDREDKAMLESLAAYSTGRKKNNIVSESPAVFNNLDNYRRFTAEFDDSPLGRVVGGWKNFLQTHILNASSKPTQNTQVHNALLACLVEKIRKTAFQDDDAALDFLKNVKLETHVQEILTKVPGRVTNSPKAASALSDRGWVQGPLYCSMESFRKAKAGGYAHVFWPADQKTRLQVDGDGTNGPDLTVDHKDAQRSDISQLFFFDPKCRLSSRVPDINEDPYDGFKGDYVSTLLAKRFAKVLDYDEDLLKSAFFMMLMTARPTKTTFKAFRKTNTYYPGTFKGIKLRKNYTVGTGILLKSGGEVGNVFLGHESVAMAPHETLRYANFSVELYSVVHMKNPFAAAREDNLLVLGYGGGDELTFIDPDNFEPTDTNPKTGCIVSMIMRPDVELCNPCPLKGYFEQKSFFEEAESVPDMNFDWDKPTHGSLFFYNTLYQFWKLHAPKVNKDVYRLNKDQVEPAQISWRERTESWSEGTQDYTNVEDSTDEFGPEGSGAGCKGPRSTGSPFKN